MNSINEKIDIQTGSYVKLRYDIASPLRRVVGCLIDWLPYIPLSYVLYTYSSIDFALLLLMIITVSYNLIIEYATNGRSLGKKFMGTRVVTMTCTSPSFVQSFARWIMMPIDVMLIGTILISRNGCRLGDRISGCVVVLDEGLAMDEVIPERDFKFSHSDYTPSFPQVITLMPEEVNAIRKVLYTTENEGYLHEVAQIVKMRLQINNYKDGDINMLRQVLQDSYYFANQDGDKQERKR